MGYNDYMRQREAMIKAIQAQAAQDTSEQPTEQDRAHLFTTGAGVGLPLAQAAITGLLFGLAVWIYAALLKVAEAWRWGAGFAVGVAVLTWLILLVRWSDLTRPIEKLTHLDINRDGLIGDLPVRPVVRVEVRSNEGKRAQFADIPTTHPKMIAFAKGVINGTPISESNWTGKGKTFSIDEFRAVRDVFLSRGWMRWKNNEFHDQGLELAPFGREVMRTFANETAGGAAHSPTLARDDT